MKYLYSVLAILVLWGCLLLVSNEVEVDTDVDVAGDVNVLGTEINVLVDAGSEAGE